LINNQIVATDTDKKPVRGDEYLKSSKEDETKIELEINQQLSVKGE
jgi:hypothetical protein